MMANRGDSRPLCARLQSAGISLRLVRAPLAPRITITFGPAGLAAHGMSICHRWHVWSIQAPGRYEPDFFST